MGSSVVLIWGVGAWCRNLERTLGSRWSPALQGAVGLCDAWGRGRAEPHGFIGRLLRKPSGETVWRCTAVRRLAPFRWPSHRV